MRKALPSVGLLLDVCVAAVDFDFGGRPRPRLRGWPAEASEARGLPRLRLRGNSGVSVMLSLDQLFCLPSAFQRSTRPAAHGGTCRGQDMDSGTLAVGETRLGARTLLMCSYALHQVVS